MMSQRVQMSPTPKKANGHTPHRLQLGEGLTLPIDAVTQTFAILAKRGSGKTYTASVFVEELVAAELPVAVLDPLGVWWGLRADADGKGPGLPVRIIGGEHGDVPIEVGGAGAVIADFLVEARVPCVIDLSGLRSKNDERRFVTDFAERLYKRKAKEPSPLHIVIDEADMFAPQDTRGGGKGGLVPPMLGAIEDLVRRGRARGIGLTLITQRPAVLNKNVLTQSECLILLRMTSPQDRDAIDDWIKMNADDVKRKEVLSSLATLPVGTAWVWSPGWLDLLAKGQIRKRRTYDSSSTPTAGKHKIIPKTLAPVDLEALKAKIAATIERVKAEDPKHLRNRIVELERELEAAKRTTAEPERVEVHVDRFPADAAKAITVALTSARISLDSVVDEMEAIERVVVETAKNEAVRPTPMHKMHQNASPPLRPRAPAKTTPDGWKPGKCETAILGVLAQRDGKRTTSAQLAALAGYSVRSSGFANALGALRSRELITGSGADNRITDDGRALAPSREPLPRGHALLEMWLTKLGKCEAAIVRALYAHHPNGVPRDDLARDSGYSASSSGFANALGALRTIEIVARNGEPRFTDDFSDALSGR